MDCGRHQAPAEYRADEGCPTLLVRIPVRIVVLVVVLPVRMAWDALAVAARAVHRDAWRALAGGAREPEARELGRRVTRTLGSTTTVPSAAPEPEISSPGEKNAERG
ncbi:hypothetical protein [Streptomyces sp. NPDC056921]|uniref:hypothetical protein n=1 Tax=Streptomyces sp. NPDC056921 TaxID=3345966 RepID=UPI0036396E20